MPNHMQLRDIDGSISLTFPCGELPADDAIMGAGHEPNGYFWEGVAHYLAPELADKLEFDPEAGMFAAYGARTDLEGLQGLLEPYLDDGERITEVIRRAEDSGFQFDD